MQFVECIFIRISFKPIREGQIVNTAALKRRAIVWGNLVYYRITVLLGFDELKFERIVCINAQRL